MKAEIVTEISHLTYRKLYEVKSCHATCQNNIYVRPFKPKEGKGQTQKREWSSDKKRDSKCGGKLRFCEH